MVAKLRTGRSILRDQFGPTIAQVAQTIFDSATGRIALIPQGARLMGSYRSSSRYGQRRVAIIWSRLIMPNGDEVALDEAGADPSRAAGVKGEVDDAGEVWYLPMTSASRARVAHSERARFGPDTRLVDYDAPR